MKKLINTPAGVVEDFLRGFELAHSDIVTVNHEESYVTRKVRKDPAKVAVISGGGSGHEPLHAGFVGAGMLDGAAAGPIFTSPPAGQIQALIEDVGGPGGVLEIRKNYTGDVMNFEMADELCEDSGIPLAAVLVADDVAVENSLYTAGRRGVAGTVWVEKIAGAAAERGKSLAEVTALAQKAAESVRSMGVALYPGILPSVGKPSFDLGSQEVEIGIGIHGEPGRNRIPWEDATALSEKMLDAIVSDLRLEAGEEVFALVNGLGGTPLSELYIVFAAVSEYLEKRRIHIVRNLVGPYVTSLEMRGCSISIARTDAEMVSLWDDPVITAGLRKGR